MTKPAPRALDVPALAMMAPPASSATERPTSFQVAEGQTELIPGGTLLVTAYGLVWALIFVFIAVVYRRQSSTEQRLRTLEAALQSRERAVHARGGEGTT